MYCPVCGGRKIPGLVCCDLLIADLAKREESDEADDSSVVRGID